MSSKKEFIGLLRLFLTTGEERRIYVHKYGRSIYLDQIIVHPSNQATEKGWVREYELCRDVTVKKYEFIPPFLIKDIK